MERVGCGGGQKCFRVCWSSPHVWCPHDVPVLGVEGAVGSGWGVTALGVCPCDCVTPYVTLNGCHQDLVTRCLAA